MVAGNSSVVFPKICTKLGLLSALVTTSAVTVESFPPENEITKYHLPIKKIICEETIKAGGSMCHHHGVGKHRTHWIDKEHGSALYMVKKLKEAFDPNGIMNMGTILPYKGEKL